MPVKDYGSFVLTIALFLALPGPGNLAILSAYRLGGVRGAMVSTLGIALGDQVLIVLALGGLAAILQEWPLLFRWVEYLGAVYLIYIGLGLLRPAKEKGAEEVIKMKDFFRQSLAITLMNPKAIVFYMAFFPLFLEKGRSIDLQTWLTLAGTIALMTFFYGLSLLLMLKLLTRTVKDANRLKKMLTRLMGVLFIGFGIKLAFS
jgi:threonine/homoserine/homoserine lactone efflux protein